MTFYIGFDDLFRDVWADDVQFGAVGIDVEDEFMCLNEIFKMDLPSGECTHTDQLSLWIEVPYSGALLLSFHNNYYNPW